MTATQHGLTKEPLLRVLSVFRFLKEGRRPQGDTANFSFLSSFSASFERTAPSNPWPHRRTTQQAVLALPIPQLKGTPRFCVVGWWGGVVVGVVPGL